MLSSKRVHIVIETLLTVMSEAVVITRQQNLDIQLLLQHLLHEFAGSHLAQLVSKLQHFNTVDARLRKQ